MHEIIIHPLNFEIFNNLVPNFIEIILLITGLIPNLLNSSKVLYNGLKRPTNTKQHKKNQVTMTDLTGEPLFEGKKIL